MITADHVTAAPTTLRPAAGAGGWVIFAGLALVVVLALRLTAVALNDSLSSDVIYSYLLSADVLGGKFPLSGWSFGGAPFFFPDFLIQLPALAATGPGGASFAVFAVVYGLALAGAVAAVARWWAGCRPAVAWLAGVLAANSVFALQFFPQHVPVLWLLPLPGYHGGTLLNGLALVAFAGRLLRGPTPDRWLWFAAGGGLVAGLCSDSLLLVQFVGPLAVAVWWLERRGGARAGVARQFAVFCAAALAGTLLVRLGLAFGGWGYYYRLGFRQTPTPTVLWHAAGKFLHEVAGELGPRAWGWGVGLTAWLALLIVEVRRRNRAKADPRGLALHLFVALSIVGMVNVLLVVGFWKSWVNVRYLLNVLLLPPVVVAIAVARSSAAERLGHGRRAQVLALLLACTAGGVAATLDPAGWRFQPTPASRDFAAVVERHGLHHGLAGYWQANLLDVLGGSLRVNALKADAQPYFWCNNAYWYFDAPGPDGTLRWPVYDFILTAELDRAAVLARYGPPAEIVQEGGWEVFIYDAAGQARIRAALAPEVVEKLGPARLRGLRPVF